MKNTINFGEVKYYTDEHSNEFVKPSVCSNVVIDENYKYLPKSKVALFFRKLFYFLFAHPILFIILKFKYHIKVVGRKNLKGIKGGYCIYSNHANTLDACLTAVFVARRKYSYVISHKDAVSIPGISRITKWLGVLPVADTIKGTLKLNLAVEKILKQGNVLSVFPEAAIWPYCTFVRDFHDTSFHFSAKNNVPAVPVAMTFRYANGKNKLHKKPYVTINICKPIYPDENLSVSENKKTLCEKTKKVLKELVENSNNVSFYIYKSINEKQ